MDRIPPFVRHTQVLRVCSPAPSRDVAENRNLDVFVGVQERSDPMADEFCDRRVGDLNALCGLVVNPEVNMLATLDHPVGMHLGSGYGWM